MKFEKPQKGNPYGLTVMQHTFPARSIARYVASDGAVALYHIDSGKVLRLPPEDQIFCAKRTWDERAETKFMRSIEDKFQELAESIIAGTTRQIDDSNKAIVNDFFALWNIRAHWKRSPMPDQTIKNAFGVRYRATKDEQEMMEKNDLGFIRPDLTIPGRMIAGALIHDNIVRVGQQLADAEWGILIARDAEFIVPDNFSNARCVPINPTLCLYSPSSNHVIPRSHVAAINRLAIASSREWYFASHLFCCPE